jgi:hypothetical protein
MPLLCCLSSSGLSRIGDTDFTNPALTCHVNLALTVGVVIPVLCETLRDDLWPSFSNDLRIHHNHGVDLSSIL